MNTYKRFNIKIVRGRGSWVWDDKGNKYLDAVAGIATCSIGHSNRILRKELSIQLKKLQHISNLYHIEEQEKLAETLVKESCCDKVFFCNSGAEANEAAIKLIRKHANINLEDNNSIILCAKSSFHGRTIAAVSATGQPKYHKGFAPLLDGIHFFEYNNISSFKDTFQKIIESNKKVAGVLIEPLQGEGGVIPGDKNFFRFIRDTCSENNSLLIFDEVQTGIGRTGKLWGYQNLDIEPDAFTIAKGLGGGHAIGAFLVKDHIDFFNQGDHASTFGGNPFACKAGTTVIKEINRKNILNNVLERGNQLREGLSKICSQYPDIISEIRGLGLIQGIQINKTYSANITDIVHSAIKNGLLIVPAGEDVIRMVPPLNINRFEINQLLKKLNRSFYNLYI